MSLLVIRGLFPWFSFREKCVRNVCFYNPACVALLFCVSLSIFHRFSTVRCVGCFGGVSSRYYLRCVAAAPHFVCASHRRGVAWRPSTLRRRLCGCAGVCLCVRLCASLSLLVSLLSSPLTGSPLTSCSKRVVARCVIGLPRRDDHQPSRSPRVIISAAAKRRDSSSP